MRCINNTDKNVTVRKQKIRKNHVREKLIFFTFLKFSTSIFSILTLPRFIFHLSYSYANKITIYSYILAFEASFVNANRLFCTFCIYFVIRIWF